MVWNFYVMLCNPKRTFRSSKCRRCSRRINCLQVAAHAADIARHRAGARDRDDELSHARYNFDWNKQFELSLDPERAKQYHDETLPEEIFKKAEFCSMCGPKHCPMNSKISDESLDQLKDKLEECNTSV